MMTLPLIIAVCVLILIAYVFDITSRHTKVPTVIFLLILGWVLKQVVVYFEISMLNLTPLLLVFGTIGLVLIVLEGGLELEINKEKNRLIRRSVLAALIPLFVLFLVLGFYFHYQSGSGLMDSLINAVPFCIISSAIAIPSVAHLHLVHREQVIYESSMSDIIGVILFNFLVRNEVMNIFSFLHFGLQLIIILIVSLVSSIILALLIKKIKHHVKLIPIMMMVVLIYSLAKLFHLPALLFILIFGIFLNNLDEFKQFSFIRYLKPKLLDVEVHRFSRLVGEASFLIRTMFFILFGYTITTTSLLNLTTLPYAILILALILFIRYVQLRVFKQQISPLLFIAPRGLITVMLFLSIPLGKRISMVNDSLILQVVILSVLAMMVGLVIHRPTTR